MTLKGFRSEKGNRNPVKSVYEKSREWLHEKYRRSIPKRMQNQETELIKFREEVGKELNKIHETIDSDYACFDYNAFENTFRGSEELIRERQREYLPFLKNCKSLIDIGCGRGELLDLIRKSGIKSMGVELYKPYAEAARKRGLKVVYGDGIEYLKKCGSVDAVIAMQVIEHLTTSKLVELVQTAYDHLNPGGVMILETPNPMSLYTFTHAFYIDPTHKNPIHPYFMRYLANHVGFDKVDILFTENSKGELPDKIDLNEEIGKSGISSQLLRTVMDMLFGSQDYAIIAYKNSNREKYKYSGTTDCSAKADLFSLFINMEDNVFDVSEASVLSNEDFLRLAFMTLFHRYPNEDDMYIWADQLALSPDEFQAGLLKGIIDSEELKVNESRIVNNPYVL